MSLKWSSSEIKKFFDLYKKHEILWNIHRIDYRARESRNHVWELLLDDIRTAGLVCESVVDLKNKLRILKTVYMQEVRKIKNSKITANSADEIYKPKLAWFEKANSFLKDVSGLRLFVPNRVKTIKSVKHEKATTTSERTTEQYHNIQITQPSSPPDSFKKFEAKKKCQISNKGEFILRRVERKLDREDQFDVIGKNVAIKLRSLPVEAQIYAEKFINDILFEAKVGNINRHSKMHIAGVQKEEIPQPDEYTVDEVYSVMGS